MTLTSSARFSERNAIGIVTRMGQDFGLVACNRARCPQGNRPVSLSTQSHHATAEAQAQRDSAGRGAARSARLDLSLQHIGTFKELKVSKV